MITNKKLIISDLDGTLLNDKSELTPFTINAVQKIVKAGHIFCISTGRPQRSTIKFYRQLGLSTIMSSLNGGVMSNPSEKDFDDISFTFDKEVLHRILEDENVQKFTNYVIVENINSTYLISKNKNLKVTKELLNRFHIDEDTLIYVDDINKIDNNDIFLNPISILISLEKKNIDQVSFSIKSFLNTFIIRMWNDESDGGVVIELNTLFSTKGTAMKYLSCYYGISLSETYAFGDGENDIEMIRSIPNAYAMKNALPSLKLISYKITQQDNNADGVVKELLKELNI